MEQQAVVSWEQFWVELQQALSIFENGAHNYLLRPWGQIQIGLIVILVAIAWLVGRTAAPRLQAYLEAQDQERLALRAALILARRLRLIVFLVGSWTLVLILKASTWPSRSYLLWVAATVVTVWLVASIATRFVRNRFVAKLLTTTIWVAAALQILDLMPATVGLLDAVAVSVGQLRLSLFLLVKAFLMLALLLWGAGLLSQLTERRIAAVKDMSPSVRVLTGKLVRIALFTVAIMIGLQSIGFDLTGLTVFSGAVGVGLGFGLQKVVSNLVSGVILLIDKSIKPGDVIEVGNTFGWIAELGGRYVSVVTRDGREYLIPNEDLITNQVINWSHTDPRVRIEVPFGVAYDSDPHEVRRIAIEATKNVGRVIANPPPVCHLANFGESSLDFVLRFWMADPSSGVVNLKGAVMLALWDALKENGIGIPYPHRDVLVRGPIEIAKQGPAKASKTL